MAETDYQIIRARKKLRKALPALDIKYSYLGKKMIYDMYGQHFGGDTEVLGCADNKTRTIRINRTDLKIDIRTKLMVEIHETAHIMMNHGPFSYLGYVYARNETEAELITIDVLHSLGFNFYDDTSQDTLIHHWQIMRANSNSTYPPRKNPPVRYRSIKRVAKQIIEQMQIAGVQL